MIPLLIQTKVIDELAELAGVGEQVKPLQESAMQGKVIFKKVSNKECNFKRLK